MIVPFPQGRIEGHSHIILATELRRTCRPQRLITIDHASDDILVVGVTYARLAERCHGPWWPKMHSAPLSMFKVSAAKSVDLSIDMPYLASGIKLEVHLFNQAPQMHYFNLAFEAMLSGSATEMVSDIIVETIRPETETPAGDNQPSGCGR